MLAKVSGRFAHDLKWRQRLLAASYLCIAEARHGGTGVARSLLAGG